MKTVVFSWGRVNPPTRGHEKLYNAVLSIAKKNKATPMFFVSKTQDKKKNPLSYEDKYTFLKHVLGKEVQYNGDRKTVFDVLNSFVTEGYQKVIFVVGSDRVEEFKKMVSPYVGKGKDLPFEFQVESAGERDPDDENSDAGISGTKMRQFVVDGDFASFKKWLPSKTTPKQAQEIFDLVKAGMQLK